MAWGVGMALCISLQIAGYTIEGVDVNNSLAPEAPLRIRTAEQCVEYNL